MNSAKILFLDRDGTVIKDKCYMHDPSELEFIDGSIEALRRLQGNYSLVVVTNQSGIGRGRFGLRDYELFNEAFLGFLKKSGVEIKATLYCPHGPDENCDCRKPKTRLVDEWLLRDGVELDKTNSWMVGDKLSDMEFADNLGIKGILISTSKVSATSDCYVVAKNLRDVAEIII